ncbi:hypothetical protein BV25DRAFT_1820691 [Artomyces pyxidatus]|uniref:Uncharacterized protein n=1 Tax=Artomyces pyxidatus TaxID=48021 RepID=A0ACB8TE23_9AGAM|nr:hypothetical protein BV25DRAFT_1820691 [Artomyces pyxidatus]
MIVRPSTAPIASTTMPYYGPGPVEIPVPAYFGTLFPALIVETVLHGIFTSFIAFSSYFLLRQGLQSRPRLWMFVATTVMFVVAELHWAMNISLTVCVLGTSCSPLILGVPYGTWQQVVKEVALVLNFVLSDLVVVWRAWLLWERPSYIMAVSVMLSLGAIAAAIADIALAKADGKLSEGSSAGLAFTLLSFITNIWATGLIAYKAWRHRRSVRAHLREGDRRTRVEKTLALLIESGFVYCIIWLLYTLSGSMLLGVVSPVISESMAQISGIYPTVIIILVCLQKAQCEQAFTLNCPSSIYFATQRQTVLLSVSFPRPDEEPISPGSARIGILVDSEDSLAATSEKSQTNTM